MKHAREDYNRIQDPAGLIPEDEPVFLIRGQDATGPQTLRCWAAFAHFRGASEEIIQAALSQALAMEDWHRRKAHKTPDMPFQPHKGE